MTQQEKERTVRGKLADGAENGWEEFANTGTKRTSRVEKRLELHAIKTVRRPKCTEIKFTPNTPPHKRSLGWTVQQSEHDDHPSYCVRMPQNSSTAHVALNRQFKVYCSVLMIESLPPTEPPIKYPIFCNQ